MASEATSSQPKGEKTPGTTILPLARVKRVIKEDKDVALVNAEATFCVAAATELFMEYLVTEGFQRAKKDKRKTVYYKDLASAVSEVEQFEFLEDVIPRTTTLMAALKRRKEATDQDGNSAKKQKPANVSDDFHDNGPTPPSAPSAQTPSAPAALSLSPSPVTAMHSALEQPVPATTPVPAPTPALAPPPAPAPVFTAAPVHPPHDTLPPPTASPQSVGQDQSTSQPE